jgi:hypothetical protein
LSSVCSTLAFSRSQSRRDFFAPELKILGKRKNQQWAFIKPNIIPNLSKAQFDAKEELLARRLACLHEELQITAPLPIN